MYCLPLSQSKIDYLNLGILPFGPVLLCQATSLEGEAGQGRSSWTDARNLHEKVNHWPLEICRSAHLLQPINPSLHPFVDVFAARLIAQEWGPAPAPQGEKGIAASWRALQPQSPRLGIGAEFRQSEGNLQGVPETFHLEAAAVGQHAVTAGERLGNRL